MKTRNYGDLSKDAFDSQRSNAKSRGIEFRLTYEEWRSWWQSELDARGPRAKRGRSRLNFGMCRFLDRGPYALENIYCERPKQNRAAYCVAVYLNDRRVTNLMSIDRLVSGCAHKESQ